MEKEKVYFPCYGGCEFGSLQEAVHYVQKSISTRSYCIIYVFETV